MFLSDNLHKKLIVYTNTTEKAENIKFAIDSYLNEKSNIKGDTFLITGKLDPKVKFATATKFTSKICDPKIAFNTNVIFPRILVATASCIGAGLDSSDVYCVIRIGSPVTIVDFIQEMGQCGCCRDSNSNKIVDLFSLTVTLHDFVYLFERLYTKSNADKKQNYIVRTIPFDVQ